MCIICCHSSFYYRDRHSGENHNRPLPLKHKIIIAGDDCHDIISSNLLWQPKPGICIGKIRNGIIFCSLRAAQMYCLLLFSEQYVDYESLTCPAKERDQLSGCEPDILGVLLIRPLDNREIPRAKGVAFVWRNRGANVLIGRMIEAI